MEENQRRDIDIMLTNLGRNEAEFECRNAVVEFLQQRVHYRDLRMHVHLPVLP